jgi:hypothetical protein
MTTPTVHYGDKVVTVPEQFASIAKDLTALNKKVNVLVIVISLHLMGLDVNVGAALLKYFGVM